MTFKLDRSARLFASVLLLAACRGDDPGDGSGSTTEPLTTTGGSSSTGTELPTTSDGTSSTTSDDTTTTGGVDATTFDSSSTCDTFLGCNSDSSSGGALPNGAQCGDDSECESTHCYSPPIAMGQGVCSECGSDSDCVEAGTGISCTAGAAGAFCASGEVGNNCESQAACMEGLYCEPVIDGLGGFIPNSCSECAETSDCAGEQLCSPVLDMMSLSGQKECVDPGSVPNNSLCPADEADGDAACMSGHCADVDVMGFLKIPVCGECDSDGDCAMGQTCTPGAFGGASINGSTCT